MCGIVAYVGKEKCRRFVLEGLSRLEYRGYDSAGFVCIDDKHKHLSYRKKPGGVALLKELMATTTFDGYVGVGHTRWATHGVITQENAHPHFNCEKTLAIVHNGIIEGFEKLRSELLHAGHQFESSTDSEVVAHLLSDLLKQYKEPYAAVVKLINKLRGAYALAVIVESFPDQIILVRKRSPLAIGIGKNEMFIASDFLAFSDETSNVIFMPEDSFAIIKKDKVAIYSFDGEELFIPVQQVNQTFLKMDKQGFEHYMLKEIYEQKRSITRTIAFCKIIGSNNSSLEHKNTEYNLPTNHQYNDAIWRQLGVTSSAIKKLKNLNLIAAGTSWHAARIAQFFFETICSIPTRVHLASEFQNMRLFPEENSMYILISQSGETADTLQALRLINSFDLPTVAITNVASSSIVRESGGFLPMQAGPEISVASTKAFSTQLATLYWLANRIALEKELIYCEDMHEAEEDLLITAEILETAIESYKLQISQVLAHKYAQYKKFIFLGRHISYPFAMEAALKLKEISYIFSQCYPAGELKHGPIALIDHDIPVVIFSLLHQEVYAKLVSNAQEIKARKGHLVVFAFEEQKELINLADTAFVVPKVKPLLAPLALTGLMQFFAYQITRTLKRPIDKPRNLAKSVTVE